jgi:hypothetical protein
VEKAYGLVAKQVILWYKYCSSVTENSGTEFPLVTRVLILLIYSLKIRKIANWGAQNRALHVGSQRVDSLGYFDYLQEVIVQFNGVSRQGCQ